VHGGAKRRILLGSAVVLAAGVFALLARDRDEGVRDEVREGVAQTAQARSPVVEDDAGEAAAAISETESRERPVYLSTRERVVRHEALPCTGPRDPINFEVFSAGPTVAGVPMTEVVRRCDAGALADESTSNYFAYIYGDCEAIGGGCKPPLQIRSYPACQRSYSEYEFEGKPLPYKELPPVGGARVREIEFLVDHRIEVYTGTSTIVISAADWSLAEEALRLLTGQPSGERPSSTADSLAQEAQQRLDPSVNGAIEGDLPCPV
jgi:hypothetical protein